MRGFLWIFWRKKMKPVNLTDRERDTVLAALRDWEEALLARDFISSRMMAIATNGRTGDDAALSADEIDDLCERINLGE